MRLSISAAILSLTLIAPIYGAEKDASEKPKITKGMKVTEALNLLRSNGIRVEELFRAVVSVDPKVNFKEFLIHPEFRSSDKAILVAESPTTGEPNFVVRRLEWHLNWLEDSGFPKTLRDDKVLYLNRLDIEVLKDLPADLKKQRKNYQPPGPNDNPFAE